jgi:hypothetical protein
MSSYPHNTGPGAGSGPVDPVKASAWTGIIRDEDRDKLVALIKQALKEDPQILDNDEVSVTVKRESGEDVLHLLGSAEMENGKERAKEIAEHNAPNGMKIVNEIKVKK